MLRSRAAHSDATSPRCCRPPGPHAPRLLGQDAGRAPLPRRALIDRRRGRTVTITLIREPASGWLGRPGRVDADLLAASRWPPSAAPRCYVCGPTSFVETVADALIALGHRVADIRTGGRHDRRAGRERCRGSARGHLPPGDDRRPCNLRDLRRLAPDRGAARLPPRSALQPTSTETTSA